jgi:hypothetical protein
MKINKTLLKFIFAMGTFLPMLNAATVTLVLYSDLFAKPILVQDRLSLVISLAMLYTYGICKVLFMAIDRIQE